MSQEKKRKEKEKKRKRKEKEKKKKRKLVAETTGKGKGKNLFLKAALPNADRFSSSSFLFERRKKNVWFQIKYEGTLGSVEPSRGAKKSLGRGFPGNVPLGTRRVYRGMVGVQALVNSKLCPGFNAALPSFSK